MAVVTAAKKEKLIFYSEEDQLEIQRAYRRLLKSIKSPLVGDDQSNIRRAYELAVDAHSDQRRKSGEAYILHPIEVARICAEEIGLGPTAIVAALLHDVVEDTNISLKEIKEQFGEKIAIIVDGLTKLEESQFTESLQADNLKKIVGTLIVDTRIVLIKMADRLHNMRTMGSMPQAKQLKIAAETEFIYAPLAHRLGLYKFKSEFMDLCLKITHRQEYTEIARQLNETRAAREQYIEAFIKPLVVSINKLDVPYRISGRPKSIYSIWNKIKQKNVPFEDIYDLFAIRIVLDVAVERERNICWQVYSEVTNIYVPLPERIKDWTTRPKSNGYESLHTTVIGPSGKYVEVQIRTERMDEIAERGYAAHWKYKGVKSQNDVFDVWLSSVREMIEKANSGNNSIEFINDFKQANLFNDEVYVYTPKGDLKMLPKGATVLDFAFAIHTEVGLHCHSAKVNGIMVPLSYKIQNADQINIETNRKRKPSEEWLLWVMTARARDRIRQSLREDQKLVAEEGKDKLGRRLDNLKVDFETGAEFLQKQFGYKLRSDLYVAVASENINLQEDLKVFKIERNKFVLPEDEKPKPSRADEPRVFNKTDTSLELFINNERASQYNFSLAECCNPVQGDDVFAYVLPNGQFKIHRSTCNNADNLRVFYGYRILEASWGSTRSSSFTVEILITGVDAGPGMIERLSNTISSDLGLNIRALRIEGHSGFFEGKINIDITDTHQLDIVTKALKNIDGITNVIRV